MKYLFFSLLLLVSCRKTSVVLKVDGVKINVEIARTEEERKTGLMFRHSLEENHGMLFIFPRERLLSFWMKNTYIPLSIAYITEDGIIKEIYEMKPESLKPVHSRFAVKYALELPKGNFRKMNARVGSRVIIPDKY